MADDWIMKAKGDMAGEKGSDLGSQTGAQMAPSTGKTSNAQDPGSSAGDGVAAMFGRLRLTSKESKTFVLDAAAEAMVNCPEWALVGKVLTPNPLHIETIKAVLHPAWGNPRGMQMRHMGPKLFLAEFETKADMLKIMNGSPWVVGRNAVLLKEFDPRVAPSDMVFDRLKLWVRIYGLPFALMNSKRGGPLAGMIGEVEKVECDERGRAWGEYLRVRINVDITEPFMRCVAVESSRLNRTVFYEVKYEKLPIFCFSCGFLGLSSLACPTPASRDADGKLPWDGDRVCVPDPKKRDQRSSGQGSHSAQGSSSRTAGNPGKQAEATSPVKPRKPRAKKQTAAAGSEKTGGAGNGKMAGLKRKQVYKVKTPALDITNFPANGEDAAQGDSLGHTEAATEEEIEQRSGDSNKKQRSDEVDATTRLADQAAAAEQPRHTQ
jgi:hypothetical protein